MSKTERITEIVCVAVVLVGVFFVGIKLGDSSGEARQADKQGVEISKLRDELHAASVEIDLLEQQVYVRDSQLRDLRE